MENPKVYVKKFRINGEDVYRDVVPKALQWTEEDLCWSCLQPAEKEHGRKNGRGSCHIHAAETGSRYL